MRLVRLWAWEGVQLLCSDAESSACIVLVALFLPPGHNDFPGNEEKVAENAGGSGLSENNK